MTTKMVNTPAENIVNLAIIIFQKFVSIHSTIQLTQDDGVLQKPRQDEPFTFAVISAQSSSKHEMSQRQDDAHQAEIFP